MKRISIVVPCRNEAAAIDATLERLLRAEAHPSFASSGVETEILVVANRCVDRTAERARLRLAAHPNAKVFESSAVNAPAARNEGASHASGDVLVFVDADTWIPEDGLAAVRAHVETGKDAGIFSLAPTSSGLRARAFFAFWNHVRRLPLARAKAMPAFMFATRGAFDRHGPFDEGVLIGEEWPILVGVYRSRPQAFVYDRARVAATSSRRMDLRRFGYLRVLARYAWAVLHASGRLDYPDDVREAAP
jgi:glycosyltransferase involved in cell wall biosynthesis